MPKAATPLNDTRIEALKPKEQRYTIADGGGLVLEVMTSGTKVWRYRYSLHSKQQPLLTIGDYPAMGLQEARERARRYAEIVASGISPIADARKDRGASKTLNSVESFAEYWFQAEIAHKVSIYSTPGRRDLPVSP